MAQERALDFESDSEDTSRKKGKNYLLLIGIDAYSSVPKLENAVKDTQAVSKVLLDRYQFEKAQTLELYNEDATRENIIEALDDLSEQVTSDDNLLIYYAGHGYYRNKLKLGYWVPVHGKDKKYASFIPHSTIRDYMKAIPAHHTFLIVDSCFSGNLLRGRGRDLNETSVYANKVDRFPSRWCLAAGMIEKVSDGFIGDHSPFARSLITFLEKNQEVRIPVQELVNHVSKATSYNADQTPIGGVILKTGDENGQFVFDLKKDEARDWQKLLKSPSVSAYRAFIKAWPAGKYTEEAFFRLACQEKSLPAYRKYLEKYESQNGKYTKEILDQMEDLERGAALQRAIRSGEASLRRFIRDERTRKVDSEYVIQAQITLDKLLAKQRESQIWQAAEQANTEASYQAYLDEFPEGPNAALAKNKIEDLQKIAEEKRIAQVAASKRKLQEESLAKRKAERIKKQEKENEKRFQQTLSLAEEVKEKDKPKEALRHIKTALSIPSSDWSKANKLKEQIKADMPRSGLLSSLTRQQASGIGILVAIFLLLIWSPWKNGSDSTIDTPIQSSTNQEPLSTPIPLRPKADILKDLTVNMIPIDGGSFEMGDQFNEGSDDEKPVHTIKLDDFYLSKYEVSFEEYDLYVNETGVERPEDEGWGRGKRPIINVSWLDAVKFCNWLSEQKQYSPVYTINGASVSANWTAKGFRLPTEAEWEYAAREKGRKIRFGNGKDVADPPELNFNGGEVYQKAYSKMGSYRGKTVEVDELRSNSLGLYHMSGNVWEWCWDWYAADYYTNSPEANSKGPENGFNRVLRGGSWYGYPYYLRVTSRYDYGPEYRRSSFGFRLARNL